MCRIPGISESGYYRWLKNRAKPTARELLSVEIRKIAEEYPDNDNYGVNRMKAALEQNGILVIKRNGTLFRQCENGKFFCDVEEGKDIQDSGVQENVGKRSSRLYIDTYSFITTGKGSRRSILEGYPPVAYRERMTKKLPLVA